MKTGTPNVVVMTLLASGAAATLTAITPAANAAEQNRSYLIERFQDGDIPTGQDFSSLIDSCLNLTDDGLTSYRIGVSTGTASALRLEAGMTVGPALSYLPISANPSLAPLWLGQSGFLPIEFRDAALQSHYGFFQLHMASGPYPPAPGQTGPAIFVDTLVWETDANVPMAAHTVPAPTGTSVLAGSAILALRRRRHA